MTARDALALAEWRAFAGCARVFITCVVCAALGGAYLVLTYLQ